MLNFSTRTCSKLFRTVVVLEFKWEKNNKPQKILWKMFVNKWFDKSWKEISGACTPQLQCKFLDASHHGWCRDFSSLVTRFICFFWNFLKPFIFVDLLNLLFGTSRTYKLQLFFVGFPVSQIWSVSSEKIGGVWVSVPHLNPKTTFTGLRGQN